MLYLCITQKNNRESHLKLRYAFPLKNARLLIRYGGFFDKKVLVSKMKRLLVQVSVTEMEFQLCKKRLMASLKNILQYFQNQADVLIVYQTITGTVPEEDLFSHNSISVYCTSEHSVSKARNKGICEAVKGGYRYILFHDSHIFVTRSFIEVSKAAIEQEKKILLGKLEWDENYQNYDYPLNVPISFRKIRPNVLRDTYVWLYFISLELIKDIRFNEKIGPGEGNLINAGEDVLFLYTIFSKKNPPTLYYCREALIVHTPRPTDFSKQLAYAKAQGVLYRYMMERKSCPYYIYFYFMLHILNTIYRIIGFKPKSLQIAKRRLVGFIDAEKNRRLISQRTDEGL